ncbi:MAG TPA: hypothetical protein VKP65_01795, partial [Rhodothermales bacterium]|nr:hypothetical protein [Rhodothermales bacterium]
MAKEQQSTPPEEVDVTEEAPDQQQTDAATPVAEDGADEQAAEAVPEETATTTNGASSKSDEGASEDKKQLSNVAAVEDSALERYTAHFPDWAKEFARKYFTKTLNQFVIHGNVRDLVPTLDEDGQHTYVSLREFLTHDLFAARDVVVFYDR